MFKDRLKEYRKMNGLTQKDLAEKLEVTRSNISEMEAGRVKGSIKILKKLSDLSGKSISYWTGDEEDFIKRPYEALDTFIDTLIDINEIPQSGIIPDKYKKIILDLLEKEIALKIEKSKE